MTPYIGPALRGPTVNANTHLSNVVVDSPPPLRLIFSFFHPLLQTTSPLMPYIGPALRGPTITNLSNILVTI